MEEKLEAKNKPSYECAAYRATEPIRKMVTDCAGGERTLKAGGQAYLPAFALETQKDNFHQRSAYDERLAQTTTYPALRDTLEGLTGLVFSVPPVLSESGETAVPEQIRAKWDNIDNEGTKGTAFCQKAFYEFLRDGYFFIVVDLPKADSVTNATEERQANLQPYWCPRTACQAVSWKWTTVSGQRRLRQIVFHECKMEDDGEYGEREAHYYSTWRLAKYIPQDGIVENRATLTVEKEIKDEKTGEKTYILVDYVVTKLTEIPVAIAGNPGDCPPFEDLARLNIRHRRQDSDYMAQLPFAGVLAFVRKGVPEEDRSKVEAFGSRRIFDVPADGDLLIRETSGAAMAVHKEALKDLKDEMASIGLSTLLDRGQIKTATEVTLDSIKDNSQLAMWATEFKDCVEQALYFHALYLGLESGGTISIGANLNQLTLSVEEMNFYLNMYNSDAMDLKTLYALLKRAGKSPDDFDIDAMMQAIEEKKAKAIERQQAAFDRASNPNE